MTKYRRQQLDSLYIAVYASIMTALGTQETVGWEADHTNAQQQSRIAVGRHLTDSEKKNYRFAADVDDRK